ncbi:MAG: hypothetical protein JSR46_04300 [Verrucomicrobia bacterium]|nr:hypothetical protein [Verrucomicrobiota bacterium]
MGGIGDHLRIAYGQVQEFVGRLTEKKTAAPQEKALTETSKGAVSNKEENIPTTMKSGTHSTLQSIRNWGAQNLPDRVAIAGFFTALKDAFTLSKKPLSAEEEHAGVTVEEMGHAEAATLEAHEQRIANFSQTDKFDETSLKNVPDRKGLYGTAKEIKNLPISTVMLSLDRLTQVKMKITVDGETVLESGGEKKTVEGNITKLLTAINKSMGTDEKEIPKKVQGRVAVLADSTSSQSARDALETVDTNGTPKAENRDVHALKLLTKEHALIGIIPMQAQLGNYCENNNIQPKFSVKASADQAEAIDITRTPTGFNAVHTFQVPIVQNRVVIATVTLKMTSDVNEETGKVTGTFDRSNLRFSEGVPLEMQQHVLNALDAPLPTQLQKPSSAL